MKLVSYFSLKVSYWYVREGFFYNGDLLWCVGSCVVEGVLVGSGSWEDKLYWGLNGMIMRGRLVMDGIGVYSGGIEWGVDMLGIGGLGGSLEEI